MAVLKLKVECSICHNQAEKSMVRLMNPLEKEKRYECYRCFKGSKNNPLLKRRSEKSIVEKKDLLCGYCKYKFRSMKMKCPYCGKSDFLVERNIKTVDLLA